MNLKGLNQELNEYAFCNMALKKLQKRIKNDELAGSLEDSEKNELYEAISKIQALNSQMVEHLESMIDDLENEEQ